jgi:hypothetical protein
MDIQSANGKAFWERHEDHPDGEVFVAGDAVVTVADTASVRAALKNGRIIKVERRRAPTPKRKPKK